MKKAVLFFILFLSVILHAKAHKDLIVHEKFGNVRVFLRTGFHYSEVEKIKVIGQLSEKLCSKLSYKDTLFIECVQDYMDVYSKDVYQFENNTNWGFQNGLRNIVLPTILKSGISVRINADHLKITNVLSLVEFALLHQKDLSQNLVFQKVIDRWGDLEQEIEFKIKSVPDTLLKQIFAQNSQLLQELISERTYITKEENIGIETYWMNDLFTFEYKSHDETPEKLLEVSDYFYLLELRNYSLLLFTDKNKFYYLTAGDKNNNTQLEVSNTSFVPFRTLDLFQTKVVLFNNYNDPPEDFYLFLKDKRKVISKFE